MENRISILDASTMGSTDQLQRFNSYGSLHVYQTTFTAERVQHIADSNIVITNKVIIDKEIMDACPSIELICITATGTNNVDLEYAKAKNIQVKNVAGYSTNSVAQHTFAQLFYLLQHSTSYDKYVKDGHYSRSQVFTNLNFPIHEIAQKTWGIVGLGAIGRKVAAIAEAFDCKVQYYSTSGKNSTSDFKQVDLEELLKTSDILSIHAPLNDRTLNLIGEVELQLMKPTAYLLNEGRGGIVNEKALAEAIDGSQIAGAAVDVLSKEPVDKSNPLLHVSHPEKVYITPHIAWASVEARERLLALTANNVEQFLGQ